MSTFSRFSCHDGVNDIARKILEIGDLKIHDTKPKETEDTDIPIREQYYKTFFVVTV